MNAKTVKKLFLNDDLSLERAKVQFKGTCDYVNQEMRKQTAKILRKRITAWYKKYPWNTVGKKRVRFSKVT